MKLRLYEIFHDSNTRAEAWAPQIHRSRFGRPRARRLRCIPHATSCKSSNLGWRLRHGEAEASILWRRKEDHDKRRRKTLRPVPQRQSISRSMSAQQIGSYRHQHHPTRVNMDQNEQAYPKRKLPNRPARFGCVFSCERRRRPANQSAHIQFASCSAAAAA